MTVGLAAIVMNVACSPLSEGVTPSAYVGSMALRPACFNSPDSCERNPPFVALPMRAGESSPRSAPAVASKETVQRVLDEVDGGRRRRVEAFLRAVSVF